VYETLYKIFRQICTAITDFFLETLIKISTPLGDLCAAKFADGNWYRARVERMAKGGSNVEVLYVDYGNRESVASTSCAALPSAFTAAKPYAHEYTLACVKLPSDVMNKI
jgi:Tudor domain